MNTNCIICGSSNTHVMISGLYDDRYGYPGSFDLLRCRDCNHKTLLADISDVMVSRLYTDYYPRSSYSIDQYKPAVEVKGCKAWFEGLYRSAFRWVPKNVKVLEIGSGFCETLGYYRQRGCDAYGVEVDENIRKIVEKYNFNVHFGKFSPDLYQAGYFDYVTMDQLLEHIVDPVEFMKGISTVVKKGGTVIVSTPNSNGLGAKLFSNKWLHWHVPYHVNYYSVKSLNILAKKTGFKVKKVKHITFSEWMRWQLIHIRFFPALGMPSYFWDTSGKKDKPISKKHSDLFIDKIVMKKNIYNIVMRLLDAVNQGDNYLFFLEKE
ncbi:MAG TPA: class I SAM-dependent methyltransferase [Spirochaetota bacterium]|nr:class I SAM-dependent methyltransferase [Spirochaetota bacterium]